MIKSLDIAIIIPTKDRPNHIKNLLDSIKNLNVKIGQILIADGSKNVSEMITSYKNDLNIQWLDCPEIGQINQRNYALKFINPHIKIVAYLDDDLILDKSSIKNIINFWNETKPTPAGVSFNITNLKAQPNSFFRKIFCMQLEPFGKVLLSGYNTPIVNINKNIKSDWLLGGATLWRKDILDSYIVPKSSMEWAISEDLIFSYPISKKENLYVCANAKVLHIDKEEQLSFYKVYVRSKIGVLRRYEFVLKNKNLYKTIFFWMMIGQLLGLLCLSRNNFKSSIFAFWGTLIGLIQCLKL